MPATTPCAGATRAAATDPSSGSDPGTDPVGGVDPAGFTSALDGDPTVQAQIETDLNSLDGVDPQLLCHCATEPELIAAFTGPLIGRLLLWLDLGVEDICSSCPHCDYGWGGFREPEGGASSASAGNASRQAIFADAGQMNGQPSNIEPLSARRGGHRDQRTQGHRRVERVSAPCRLDEAAGVLLQHQALADARPADLVDGIHVGFVARIALLDRRARIAGGRALDAFGLDVIAVEPLDELRLQTAMCRVRLFLCQSSIGCSISQTAGDGFLPHRHLLTARVQERIE